MVYANAFGASSSYDRDRDCDYGCVRVWDCGCDRVVARRIFDASTKRRRMKRTHACACESEVTAIVNATEIDPTHRYPKGIVIAIGVDHACDPSCDPSSPYEIRWKVKVRVRMGRVN